MNDPSKISEAAVMVMDNEVCERLLFEAGQLENLRKKPQNPRHTMSTLFFNFNKHYIMAMLHYGHSLEKDNGYVLTMLPEKFIGKEEAAKFFGEIIARGLGEPESMTWRTIQSQITENN